MISFFFLIIFVIVFVIIFVNLIEDNPFLSKEDPFADGVCLLKEGDLKQSILAFEAAVQKNPQNAEGWRYLGQAQAENEQEHPAIAASLKAISIDPYNLDVIFQIKIKIKSNQIKSNQIK